MLRVLVLVACCLVGFSGAYVVECLCFAICGWITCVRCGLIVLFSCRLFYMCCVWYCCFVFNVRLRFVFGWLIVYLF